MAEALAYARRIGVHVKDEAGLVGRVEAGIRFRSFERLREQLGCTARELADIVAMSPRTLARRKTEGRLHPEESDRVLRVARLVDEAISLFEGDTAGAVHWLRSPRRALGGHTPLEFARTEVGAREVEGLIGRLERGVYS